MKTEQPEASMEDILRRVSGQLTLRKGASAEALEQLQRRLGVCLPEDYLTFLSTSDGAEGSIGPSSYVALGGVDEVVARNERLNEIRRGLFIFGSDGGEEAYAFELESGAMRVVEVPFEVMGIDQPKVRAESFAGFLRYLEEK